MKEARLRRYASRLPLAGARVSRPSNCRKLQASRCHLWAEVEKHKHKPALELVALRQ